jgi:CBS domain-containing protein
MSNLAKIAATPLGEVPAGALARVSPETPLHAVVTEMHSRDRGAVLVVEGSSIIGIFTERDVMKRIDHRDFSWHKRPVREVMTPNPMTIRTDQTIEDAINKMTAGSVRRLPLVDPEGTPVAILSIRHILAFMVEFYPQEFVNLPPDPDHEAAGRWGG